MGLVKKQTSILEKYFSVSMSNHSRAPKTCFTLGLKLFGYISRFRCTIVRSFQRANPAMLKKIIYVVSVIHRV